MTKVSYNNNVLRQDAGDNREPESLKERIAKSEEKIIYLLRREQVTAEELFWLRVDMGRQYLEEMKLPERDRKMLQDDPAFWAWWRSVWAIEDMRTYRLLSERAKELGTRPFMIWSDYVRIRLATCFCYKVNRTLMEDIHQSSK